MTFFSKNVFVASVDSYAFNLSRGEQYMHYALFVQSDEELNRLLSRIHRRLCRPDDIYTLITKDFFNISGNSSFLFLLKLILQCSETVGLGSLN